MNIMTSNDIFKARTLMAAGNSLKDTAKMLNTTQATVRRYLPEQAEEARLLNKPATATSASQNGKRYVTKAELVKHIKRVLPNMHNLENAPLETVEQIFRSLPRN